MTATASAHLIWVDETGTGYLEAIDSEGTWRIGPVVEGNSAPIGFHLAGWSEDTHASLMEALRRTEEGSRERARLRNILSIAGRDQGRAATQVDARAAIDVLRHGDLTMSTEDVLVQAKFSLSSAQDGERQYRSFNRKSPNGAFSLFVSETTIQLRHDRRGSRFSDPLLTLSLSHPTYDGKGTVWFFWPERVEQHFLTLAIQAAVKVADGYLASGRNQTRRRRAA